MIADISEINREIATLEAKQTTLPVLEKLALLYIVRDHNEPNAVKRNALKRGYSQSSASSEFKQAAMRIPADSLLDILDEHMEAIKILSPKEYAAILKKIAAV